MSLRDRNKSKRRARILMAARGLIVDEGVDGLNMRALAEAAETSVATLYNLVGSKEEILLALLDQSFDTLSASAAAVNESDPIARTLSIVEAACEQFIEDALFYKHLLRGLHSIEHGHSPSKPILKIWKLAEDSVQAAIDAGECEDWFAARISSQQILAVFSNMLRLWSIGRIDDTIFKAQCLTGTTMALLAIAKPHRRDDLRASIEACAPIILDRFAQDEERLTGPTKPKSDQSAA